jgi:nucleotide-binding universal stress UspA family protein
MNFKKILVPVDFSEFSNKAVEFALFAAEKYDAHITLLHIIVLFQEDVNEEMQLQEYEKFVQMKEKESYRLLQLHNKEAEKRGVTIDSKILRRVSAADSILEFINDNDFDLVVMGTHGRTGLKKWMYGSVAEKVVRLSPVPVLTTHHPLKKFAIEKILVPLDFSEYSKKASDTAIQLARRFNAALTFLHVIEQEYHPAFYTANVESIFRVDPELRDRSTQKLREFTGYESEDVVYVVSEGKAFKEIVEYARKNHSDIIVMATRGFTGLEHLLIGSTTERVVRLAPCPVLTVERNY